jgi:hypothetical protein
VSRRQISEPVQWLIIIGMVVLAWAVALLLLSVARVVIVAAWAVWG